MNTFESAQRYATRQAKDLAEFTDVITQATRWATGLANRAEGILPMRMNTCASTAPTARVEDLKQYATARQRRAALRIELAELEASTRGGCERALELRAMIGVLDELIGDGCE